jgi:hypothetical protein
MRRKYCSVVVEFTVLAIGVLMATCPASAKNVDLQALTQETQRLSQKPDEMTMVWWIPEEFWSASLAQAPNMTSSQVEEFLKVIRPYTMVVVVDGTMGAFGGVTYKSEDSIRANTRLLDSQGKLYAPRTEDEVDADTKNMLQMMKPIFVNMLGPMGQNMHFLLFPGKTDSGIRIADAKGKGQFKVKLGEKEFEWRLPLDALLSTQVCGNCKQECKGSWFYCPWCGTKLTKETGSRTTPRTVP